MKIFVIITFCLISLLIFADNNPDKSTTLNTITGVVLDSQSNETLAGVKLKIDSTIYYSDVNGNFFINVNSNEVKIEASLISYDYKNIILTVDKTINLKLDPNKP